MKPPALLAACLAFATLAFLAESLASPVLDDFSEIREGLRSDDAARRDQAVQALLRAEPADAAAAASLGDLLAEVCGDADRRHVSAQRKACGERLCALSRPGADGRDPALDAKVRRCLTGILAREKANADPDACLPLFGRLLEAGDARVREDAAFCLRNFPHDSASALLDALPASADGAILDLVADLSGRSNPNPVLRLGCVKWLGRWTNGPPRYARRVPALLAALDTPAASAEALEAMRAICLPDLSAPNAWKAWWKKTTARPSGGADDLEIVREDLRELFSPKRDGAAGPGASRVLDWMQGWHGTWFRWSVPVLIDPLLQRRGGEDSALLLRVVSVLGGAGDPAALAPLEALSRSIDPADRLERRLLRETILAEARIAAACGEPLREKTGQALETFLKSLHEDVIGTAAEAMGLLQHLPSGSRLLEVLNQTTSPWAAARAAEALGRMKARDALEGRDPAGNLGILPMLARCLEKPGLSEISLGLVRALRFMDIRSPAVVDHLVLAIASGDEPVCREAMTLAGAEWREAGAVEAIREVFTRPGGGRFPLRRCALEAIAAYPPQRAASCLFPVLRRPSAADRDAPSRADPVREQEAFSAIAARYFERPGNLLPEHRRELLAIVADAGSAHRPACVRWLARPGIWETRECAEALSRVLDLADGEVVAAIHEAFAAHPSAAAMEEMIQGLLRAPAGSARWSDRLRADVVSRYMKHFQGRAPVFQDPPNGKEIEAWYRRHAREFDWPRGE